MVESLTSGGVSAVAAMTAGREVTAQASASALKGAESLASVVEEMNNIALMINQTASAAEEQSLVSKSINQSVQNIVDATESTYLQFEKARESEQQLQSLSGELSDLIGEFKL